MTRNVQSYGLSLPEAQALIGNARAFHLRPLIEQQAKAHEALAVGKALRADAVKVSPKALPLVPDVLTACRQMVITAIRSTKRARALKVLAA